MTTASRIRWTDDEKSRLARAMSQALSLKPTAPYLEVLRAAQEQELPADRRREIKAWSIAEPLLGALLAQCQAGVSESEAFSQQGSSLAEKESDEEAATPAEPPLAREVNAAGKQGLQVARDLEGWEASGAHSGQPAGAVPPVVAASVPVLAKALASTFHEPISQALPESAKQASATGIPLTAVKPMPVDPMVLEAALLVAIQSPAVRAALAEVFASALALALPKATAAAGTELAEPETLAIAADFRVLMVGFAGAPAKQMEFALRERFDVRVWKPGQPLNVYEALRAICQVAVIPEGVEDDVEDSLRGAGLKVVRHEGSVSRLVERLVAMAEA